MRYLALCMGLLAVPLGLGATDGPPRRLFDIPAGGAVAALKRFSAQAGTQVIFLEDAVADARTRALKGEFTPGEALERLLAGTGLKSTRDDRSGAFAVNRPAKPDEGPPRPNAPRAAPTARNERPPRPAQDPVDRAIELSPFVVNAGDDRGYQAANTLAGSRLNTPLRDTAASISVLTEEFINDVGALDLTEAIAFGNNVELDYSQLINSNAASEFFTTFRIRGQAATVARNYFRWKLPTNTFNVGRIEEARGPNAILFGFASAGGIISASTKQAQTGRSFRRARLVYGGHDLRRATVDLNQASFDGKLGVRFNAVAAKAQGYQHHVFNEDTRGHLAVKFQPAPATMIRAEYEQGRTFRNTPDNQQVGDQVLKWIQAGRPLLSTPAADSARGLALQSNAGNQSVTYVENDGVFIDAREQTVTQGLGSAVIQDSPLVDNANFTINLGGPGQTQAATFNTWSAFIQRRLGQDTFLELAYNHQDYAFEAWQAFRYSGLQGDPNRFLRDGVTPNPHAGGLYFDTEWEQRLKHEKFDNFRFTASTEFDLGAWGSYRLAALAEREASFAEKRNYTTVWANPNGGRGGAFATAANSSANTVKIRHYVVEGDFSTYYGSLANTGATGFFRDVAHPLVPGQSISARGARQNSGDFSDPSEQDSFLAAAQAFYFQRRLALTGGYRADTLYLHEGVRGATDPVTGDFIVDNVNFPRTNRTVTARTGTYGAVWHVRPWLSLRYNRSDSFELPNTGVKLTPRPDPAGHFIGSRVGDNPRGEGEDYGIDLNLFAGKVFIRATRFSTTRAGAQTFLYGGTADSPAHLADRILDTLQNNSLITPAERNQHQISVGGSESDVTSAGYEFSVTANPSEHWRLQANWSVTDAVTDHTAPEIQAWAAAEIPYFQTFDQSLLVATGQTIAQEIARWQAANAANRSADGVATIGNRREKLSAAARYSFAGGFLAGLQVGAAARHQGRNVIAVTTAGRLLYGNSFTRLDASVGYRFGRLSRLQFLRHASLQLNVHNVLDRHAPLVASVADPDAAVPEISRLVPQEPRAWRLSAEFPF